MLTDPTALVSLPRGELIALAKEALNRQAARIYAPEALGIVQGIFDRNTAIMAPEQLAIIIAQGDM